LYFLAEPQWDPGTAAEFLLRAQPHHPGDFQINHNLAVFLNGLRSQFQGIHYSVAVIAPQPILIRLGLLMNAERIHRDPIPYCVAAIAIRPKSAAAWADYARAMADAGRMEEAIEAYRRVYSLSDRNLSSRSEEIRLLQTLGKVREVEARLAQMKQLALTPTQLSQLFAPRWVSLFLRNADDQAWATTALRKAIQLHPDDRGVVGATFSLSRHIGPAETVDLLREAVRLRPNDQFTLNYLARWLAAGPDGVRNGEEAVKLATRVCELNEWKLPYLMETLAAAYAETGNFDKAIEYQKRLIEEYTKQINPPHPPVLAYFRERLALYERKQPYRDPFLFPPEVAPPPREAKQP
jgi:tetratricopeptide (TPR) repeat protein